MVLPVVNFQILTTTAVPAFSIISFQNLFPFPSPSFGQKHFDIGYIFLHIAELFYKVNVLACNLFALSVLLANLFVMMQICQRSMQPVCILIK
jgi:hypothetical protein